MEASGGTGRSERPLEGMRVAILVSDNFEQVELTEPRRALDAQGAITQVVSPHGGQVKSMHHDERAESIDVDLTIEQADPEQFDAVFLPGGVYNADKLRQVRLAQEFIRRIDETDKPIGVICHAPWLLVSAGLVHGRTLTSYYTLQDDIRNSGGHWLDLEVVYDENWVSSRGPKDIPAFNSAMVDLFALCHETA